MTITSEEKREQVAKQCEVVAHLARALAQVHIDYVSMFGNARFDVLIEIIGKRTAYLMETLGDALNNMDAVDADADGWTFPIFETAQRLWPQARNE